MCKIYNIATLLKKRALQLINLDLKEYTFYVLLIISCACELIAGTRLNFLKLKNFMDPTFFPDFLIE